MTYEESVEQLESLIEAWQLDEADLNQTDINAMQTLLKENQELKQKYENAVADYETTMSELQELKEENKILKAITNIMNKAIKELERKEVSE